MAGNEKLEIAKNSFDYLIVDEACQCIEPSTLIPFELAPKRVILVGDQNQLPATTFSDNSEKTHFSRSLFERLLLSGYDKTMLQI
jgi:superfamily I DNA and/or RNA helicase